jgi:predicted TIM-barrel fold metal-dependent hydrolase
MPGSDREVFDTHLHVASDDVDRYPRQPTGVGSDWWLGGGFDVDSTLSVLQDAGVSRGVAVQAVGLYRYDNRYVVDSATDHPDRVTAVVAVDMDRPDAAFEIARYGDFAGVVGVRLFAVGGSDRWVETGRVFEAFEAAAASRLTVVLTVFAHHLPALRPAIERFVDVPVALDHCAFPGFAGATIAEGQALFELSGATNVMLKVSSHNLLEAAAAGEPADLVGQLVGSFGAERLMWGSDYPQTQGQTYRALVDLAERSCHALTPSARAGFMGANAATAFEPRQDRRARA